MDDYKNKTIEERQAKDKQALIDALKEMPIIQVACKRAGVSRATYYRWHNEDKEFQKLADTALTEGEGLITDMSESQLITMIKEKKFPAVHLWLRHHHPKYANRIEVVDKTEDSEELSPDQEATVLKALRLAHIGKSGKSYDRHKTKE